MINGFGPAYGYLGYQVHTRNFFRALNRIEPVCLTPTNANFGGQPVVQDLATMIARQGAINMSEPSICIAYGNDFHKFHGGYRVGYTVFEYTKLAADWINGMRQVDELWTTSRWGLEVIRQNGLADIKVEVVPEGFDAAIFNPALREQRKSRSVFRFLTVGKWEVRKGQVELLKAWAKAFRGIKDVELVLMCDNPFVRGFSVEQEIKKLNLGRMAPVKAVKPVATDVEMAKRYADADCFVLPTRAEGWGLPIMEAMACGTPVITTRYSAITEYANDANAHLLDVMNLVPVFDPLFFPRAGEAGLWAEIDIEQLAERMLHVYQNRDEARLVGLRAASDMASQWTWDHAARKAHGLLQARKAGQISNVTRPAAIHDAKDAVDAVRKGDRTPATIAVLSITDLIGIADELSRSDSSSEVADLYRTWIAHANSPLAFIARFNLGRILSDAGDLGGAEQVYREALVQNPQFPQARLNLGSVLERSGRPDAAIAEWEQALGVITGAETPDTALLKHVLNSLGRLLEQQHRYAEAETMLTRSLAVQPDQEEVLHHWVHLRQKQCAWPVYSPLPGVSVESMVRSTSALAMLSASNDPAQQLDTALRYARAKIPGNLPPLAPAQGYEHPRLRVGYLSSNLNLHAVTILTAELYELHDRSRVEVFAFCWSPEDGSPMRARIRAAMDHLIRIDQMTDEQAAQTIRAAEIDILIDLQGLTSGCRPTILAHRPAPVQIAWLGFPGTTGLPGVDYILADRYLIPEKEVQYYSEKPLYMPDCFQVNDRKRTVAELPRRATYGLADDVFVFCAFNHNHKFTPELFGTWMRILTRTPNSVLWLLADNEVARLNLISAAERQGVDSQRLVFAPRVQPTEYLARFQLADLFLDTLPFNGGTTASDALWMGLPLLTCSGRTFASRMAGSLLNAIGLPELVTTNFGEYEQLAVELASDPLRLRGLRQRLQENRATHPLFDTPRFVRAMEDVFVSVARSPSPKKAHGAVLSAHYLEGSKQT